MNEACNAISWGDVAQLRYFECIFGRVIGVALGLAGVVLFVMLIAGGLKYITAGGDPKGIESAQKTLTYAIAGIVLTAAAFLVLRLIAQFTGATSILQFKIFQPPK